MKKLLSLLLALIMCLSLFPVSVLADDAEVTEEPLIELPADESEEIPELSDPAAEPEIEETEAEVIPEEPAGETEASVEAESLEEPEDPEVSLEIENILTPQYFPDPVLLGLLTDYFTNTFDYGGVLSESDAASFPNSLFLQNRGISNAEGLSYFKNIPDLYLAGNLISSFDASGMTGLTLLDLKDCTNLTSLILPSGENVSALKYIYVSNTGLGEINASGMVSLEKLSCYDCSSLRKIDVSGCSALKYLTAGGSPVALLTLPAPDASVLDELEVCASNLTSLDVSGYASLEELDCSGSPLLTELLCTDCTSLNWLNAGYCALQNVSLSGCTSISRLWLNNNRLTDLNLSECFFTDEARVSLGTDSEMAQSCRTCVNAWTCGEFFYVDLVKEGIFSVSAKNSLSVGGYIHSLNSMNEGAYLVYAADVISYTLTCEDGNGITHDMDVYVQLAPCLGELFSVPEYMVLSTADADPAELKVTRNDTGEVLDAGKLYAAGLNLRLSYAGGTEYVTLPGEADEFSCMNKITPVAAGTSTLNWTLSHPTAGRILEGQIRVDVVDGQLSTPETGAGVKSVSLLQSSTEVELYRTDYTELDLVLELEQNEIYASAAKPAPVLKPRNELPEIESNGYAVASAEFTGEAANWFELHPEGDGKLKIVPKYEKIEAAFNKQIKVPGSFTTAAKVTLADGGEFTTGTLKIKLKKSLPEPKIRNITLNSWPGIEPELFAIEPTVTSFKNSDVILSVSVPEGGMPSWATFNTDYWAIYYTGPAKAKLSGTATLEFDIQDYAVKPRVSVKITAKPTAPKFTLSAKSVTLFGTTADQATVTFGATAKNSYGHTEVIDYFVQDFEFLRVTEGSGKKMKTYPVGDILNVERKEHSSLIKISLANSMTEAHSYKLWFRYAGAERSITVNVKPAAIPSLTLKTVKGYSGIDLTVPGSVVCFAVNGRNCGINTSVICNDVDRLNYSGTIYAPDGTDVTTHFSWYKWSDGLVYYLSDPTGLNPGKYTFSFKVYVGCVQNEGYATGKCTFTVKKPVVAPEKSIKLTLKGSLEAFVYNGKYITITAKAKGFAVLDDSKYALHIYSDDKCTVDASEYFDATTTSSDGTLWKNVIRYKEAAPGNYYARIEYDMGWGEDPVISNAVRFTVKTTAPKLSQSVKEVSLSAKDCLRASTVLRVASGNSIRAITPIMVVLDPVSSSYFDVEVRENLYGSADILLYWKNREICLKPGTVKTVKVNLYFDGYDPLNPPTYKPATVKVKVRIK